MAETRTCRACRRKRPLSEFAERDGRRATRCKRCEFERIRDGLRPGSGRRRSRRADPDPADYERGFRDGVEEAKRRLPAPIPDALILSAVALCHPDRHPPERQAEATRVTAELNALRDRP